ncbi:hypothetical protein BJ912DRAFT_986480, partial [Pholiota molesta]
MSRWVPDACEGFWRSEKSAMVGALQPSRYNARIPIRTFGEKCPEHGVRTLGVGDDILTSRAGAVHLRIRTCELTHHVEILVVEPLEIINNCVKWTGWAVRKSGRAGACRSRPMEQPRCRRNDVGMVVPREILEGVPRQRIDPRELRRERTRLHHVYEFIQHTHCLTWKTERPPRDWRMNDMRPLLAHSFDRCFMEHAVRQRWRPLGTVRSESCNFCTLCLSAFRNGYQRV